MRAIVDAQRALRADPSRAVEVGKRLFPPGEAVLFEDLVRRDAPYYSARISPESVTNLNGFHAIFITPTTVSDDGPAARRFPQQWFRPDQPYLKYPSNSNLVWLREAGIDLADDFVPESIGDAQAAEICDAFGLFGTPAECLAGLKRARDESAINHVFIFPTHTQEGGYDMPRA